MELLGVVYGIAAFYGIQSLRKPMKRMAVVATSHMFDLVDRAKESGYNLKEGFEDIIAEAQYENLKRRQALTEESGMPDEPGPSEAR